MKWRKGRNEEAIGNVEMAFESGEMKLNERNRLSQSIKKRNYRRNIERRNNESEMMKSEISM